MEIIGSDESLKGDTFGGIVVAAVKADDAVRKKLVDLRVTDSKKLSPARIQILQAKIREIAKVYFVNMYPREYNAEIQKYGLTGVLNKLHRKCIAALSDGTEKVVVDLYPGCKIPEAETIVRAESQYAEVAAASIIARSEAMKQMKELSYEIGFTLPLGSTHVIDTLVKIRDTGIDFEKYAKTSFRNVREIMQTGLKKP